MAGAAAFVIADELLDSSGGSWGFALLTGVTFDGILEDLALGVGFIGSSLSGIFASNFPEALGGAIVYEKWGRSRGFVVATWWVTIVLLTIAVVAGNVLLAGADEAVLAFARTFAAGAVLASLADTIMPDAYRQGSPWSLSPRPPASCSPS